MIARLFDLFAPFGTWVYGGEYVNPLSGEMLSGRRHQDADEAGFTIGANVRVEVAAGGLVLEVGRVVEDWIEWSTRLTT